MSREKNLASLPLDGGTLCFDFINTVHTRKEKEAHEYLPDYHEFIRWCEKVHITDKDRLDMLAAYAREHPSLAEEAMKKIKAARENLYLLFSAIANGKLATIGQEIVSSFNQEVAKALSHVQFEVQENHLQQTWDRQQISLLEPLWILMKSAHDVLNQEDYHRIKECAACGWLFLDQTKNNKRRWCNPSTCGSIEKSKRYYQKKKDGKN